MRMNRNMAIEVHAIRGIVTLSNISGAPEIRMFSTEELDTVDQHEVIRRTNAFASDLEALLDKHGIAHYATTHL